MFNDPARPLRGSPCGYCTKAPVYKWSKRIKRVDVIKKLGEEKLAELLLEGVGLDQRVAKVKLCLSDGSVLEMKATTFRTRLALRSTLVTMKADGDFLVFTGRGWGHGVGMCQWGAKGMADAGKTCAEILDQYYPGAKITKAYHSPTGE